MSKIVSWISSHKVVLLLLIIIVWLVREQRKNPIIPFIETGGATFEYQADSSVAPMALGAPSIRSKSFISEAPPTTAVSERMVVQNSHLSLKVHDVADTTKQINQYVTGKGGYMVNSSVTNPEDNASGDITVRIPQESFEESLAYFRSLSVKVVSENLTGTDVTDQYQDNAERMAILERNKTRFDEIMQKAVEIDDILRVQQELFNLQNQIDSLKGQQMYLEQTAKLSLVTLYLATDELALPYAPEQPWRPQVIFQKAVRSLLTNLQEVGSLIIWLGVYGILIVPVGIIAYAIYRKAAGRGSSISRDTAGRGSSKV